jgi:hypothetical protein
MYVGLALSLLLVIGVDRSGSAADPVGQAGEAQHRKGATGAIVTLWPLFDYRSSPATGYSNLSILGPLFKREHDGNETKTAIRPLFFTSSTPDSEDSDILYPLASSSRSGDDSDSQVLKLFQRHVSRAGTTDEKRDAMLFPLYISGQSEKYGPYKSFFPIYGDLYERFWRDEYHFALFPLYGRTVTKGTTSTNWLYPIFNTVSGENESGFQVWPLYGQAAKTGVYEKSFTLWPFYIKEHLHQDTDNPVKNLYVLPFYASSESLQKTATYAPWPFCGVVRDAGGEVVERDYFWPFWIQASSKDSTTERYLPFFSSYQSKGISREWVMWPIYRHQTINAPDFRQEKTNLLYFLFRHAEDSWPQIGKQRASSAFWPLYAWQKDEEGLRTLSFPALAEAVIWNDGVERNWAPLWRIFITKWDDKGNSATSLLWNLYWREKRGAESAWELSPLVSYSTTADGTEFRLLKGLFGYVANKEKTSLSLLWIPIHL